MEADDSAGGSGGQARGETREIGPAQGSPAAAFSAQTEGGLTFQRGMGMVRGFLKRVCPEAEPVCSLSRSGAAPGWSRCAIEECHRTHCPMV